MQKRTMTLNLSEAEMLALEEMATRQEMTKTGLIRQALRLYQLINAKSREGYEMAWTKDGRTIEAEIVGCAAFD